MIKESELRLGNYVLQKVNNKISTARVSYAIFDFLAQGGNNFVYPVMLKAEWLEKSGFIENKNYPLYPEAREFSLVVPVNGSNKNELFAYIKNNGECFGRATVNDTISSNNFYHLHQLQNIYFALCGAELEIKL